MALRPVLNAIIELFVSKSSSRHGGYTLGRFVSPNDLERKT